MSEEKWFRSGDFLTAMACVLTETAALFGFPTLKLREEYVAMLVMAGVLCAKGSLTAATRGNKELQWMLGAIIGLTIAPCIMEIIRGSPKPVRTAINVVLSSASVFILLWLVKALEWQQVILNRARFLSPIVQWLAPRKESKGPVLPIVNTNAFNTEASTPQPPARTSSPPIFEPQPSLPFPARAASPKSNSPVSQPSGSDRSTNTSAPNLSSPISQQSGSDLSTHSSTPSSSSPTSKLAPQPGRGGTIFSFGVLRERKLQSTTSSPL